VKHTFVIHLTAETGDVDPAELMGEVEVLVAESCRWLWDEDNGEAWHQVEVVDAFEAAGEGVR
jgi:hypothetical protein